MKIPAVTDQAVAQHIPPGDLIDNASGIYGPTCHVVLTEKNPDPQNPLRVYRLLEGLYTTQSQAKQRKLSPEKDQEQIDYLMQYLGSDISYIQGFDARPKNAPRQRFIDSFDEYVGIYSSLVMGGLLQEYKSKNKKERNLMNKGRNTFLSIAVDYAVRLDLLLFEGLEITREQVVNFYMNSDLYGFLKKLESRQEGIGKLLLATTQDEAHIDRNNPKTIYVNREKHPLRLQNLIDNHLR
jgi:hypothetical protein